MEPSHTPGPAAARPSLVSPSDNKAPASARILDNLAGGAGVRVPATKKATSTAPIWFGIGLVTAFALVVYGVVSQMPAQPAAVPVAVQPPVVLSPVVVVAPPPPEVADSQAATITNEPQEPAPGEPSATAAADSHSVLTNALEKDVKPPPLTLSRALESAPKASAKIAAKAPDKAAKVTKETKEAKAASAPAARPAKPDHDVEILQVLVAHNAKRRAASAAAPTGEVKSPPPQSRPSAPPATSEPALPEIPD